MDREELLFLPERAAWARAVRMFGEYVARFSGNACWPQKRSQATRLEGGGRSYLSGLALASSFGEGDDWAHASYSWRRFV